MASKRRVQLYTLPIVVGIGFLVVAGLATWRRADLIATLSDQISHGEKSQAPAAVRQLGAISNPPLTILVEAAACDDGATVEAAQITINTLLDGWQQQVDNQQRLSRVADQVSQLSAALAAQRRTFPTSTYPWLASVTHKMVRVADKCPPTKTPLLALHCDELMAQIATARFAPTDGAPQLPAAAPAGQNSLASPAVSGNQASDRRQLEQTFASFPTSSAEIERSSPLSIAAPRNNGADEDGRLRNQENPLRRESIQPADGEVSHDPSGEDDSIPASNQTAAEIDEAIPSNILRPSSDGSRAASSATSDLRTSPIAAGSYSTRELFERWRSTGGDEHRDVEHQLAARGFKHLSPALVQQYLSTGDGRSHIVDIVLKLPGAEVRPWLFLLGDDEDADVRLMAVTVMATSGDRALIEKAWQIAIRDEDPRIADLSAHLRERRGGTQLR